MSAWEQQLEKTLHSHRTMFWATLALFAGCLLVLRSSGELHGPEVLNVAALFAVFVGALWNWRENPYFSRSERVPLVAMAVRGLRDGRLRERVVHDLRTDMAIRSLGGVTLALSGLSAYLVGDGNLWNSPLFLAQALSHLNTMRDAFERACNCLTQPTEPLPRGSDANANTSPGTESQVCS